MNAPQKADPQTTAQTAQSSAPPTPSGPEPIKLVMMAPAGYRKTSALASLLSAGYNVRVIDTDNGIGTLKAVASQSPPYSPDSLARLSYATLTEPMRAVGGKIFPAKATVWPRAIGLLEHWTWTDEQTGTICDLGRITEWGSSDVLVLDTLSKLAQGALNFHLAMNGRLGQAPTGNEYRRDIGAAQGLMDALIQLLFDTSVKCNVIINTHVRYTKEDGTMPKDNDEHATLYGFPKSIGGAQGPSIPTYFKDVLSMRKVGTGAQIITRDPFMSLKSSAPFRIKPTYSAETGLAEYFADVRGTGPK